MSKKNKVSSVKKKTAVKVKKKVASKSKPAKKSPSKKAPAKKKPIKKVVVKKKAAPKAKPVKASKPAKSKVAKKVVKKAPSKPVKKVVAKAKKIVKKVVMKPVAKKPVKKAPVKAVKKPVVKAAPKAKVQDKKPVDKEVKATKPAITQPKVKAENTIQSKPELKALSKKESAESKKESNNHDEVAAVFNTIPKETVEELPASKIASIASSITNPLRSDGVYSVKVEKEPAGKFEMEFPIRASSELLYEFFSTASGLSEWFCDDVNIRNGIYTFIWDGQMQQARLLKTIDNQLARYQWVDKLDGSYFEFKVQKDELTNDISLIITDFAESASDRESSKLLWQSQIDKLMHVLGSMY